MSNDEPCGYCGGSGYLDHSFTEAGPLRFECDHCRGSGLEPLNADERTAVRVLVEEVA